MRGMRVCLALCSLAVAHAAMILTSEDFVDGEDIPGSYGCAEEDSEYLKPSPSLSWHRAPVKTQSFVLLVDDMDLDDSKAVQWLVTNIPKDVNHLDPGASGMEMPEGAVELRNSLGIEGFVGVGCVVANETHKYRFRLFAMRETNVTIDASLPLESLTRELGEKSEYCAVLTGSYTAPETLSHGLPLAPPPFPCSVVPPPGQPCPDKHANGHLPYLRYVKPSESLKRRSTPKSLVPLDAMPDCDEKSLSRRAQQVEAIPRSEVRVPARDAVAPSAGVDDPPVNRGPETVFKMPDTDMLLELSSDECDCDEELGTEMMVQLGDDLRVISNDPSPAIYHSDQPASQKNAHRRPCGCSRTQPKRFGITAWLPGISTGAATDPLPASVTCAKLAPEAEQANAGMSPAVAWRHVPSNTNSLAIMMDNVSLDIDSDLYGRVMWLVTNISPNTTDSMIPQGASGTGALPAGSTELLPYIPPCPTVTKHGTYRLRVFALSAHVDLKLPDADYFTSRDVESQLLYLSTATIQMSVSSN